MKTIGILGGVGPVATEDLYRRIIIICQKKYDAVQDSDYPPIILASLPLKGTDETGVVDEQAALKDFKDGIRRLEKAGCDFIIIPCNTVHHFIDKIRDSMKVPTLSITEAIAESVIKSKVKCVGILSSEASYKFKVHEKEFANNKIKCLIPNKEDQKKLTKIILNVMGGTQSLVDKKILIEIIRKMTEDGADSVIIGCTELSVIIDEKDIEIKVFDSLQTLAERAVKESQKYSYSS